MFVHVLAETTQGAAEPQGFDPFLLIMLAIFGVFIFMMFRRNKKAQKQVQEQQSKMVPGVEVMTSYGLFGTVVAVDEAENKVVLEISPGSTATVHRQSVTKIVSPIEDEDEGTVVPDDASSLTDRTARDEDTDSTGTAGQPDPAEGTSDRPNKDDNKDR